MKKLPLLLILTITFFAQTVYSSPLIFKGIKEIPANQDVEVVILDTTKFKQLRFHIVNDHPKVVSNTTYREFSVSIDALEGEDLTNILRSDSNLTFDFVMDTPPSKIRIRINGIGTFKIFIWASQ